MAETARDIVEQDLEYMSKALREEFARMAGRNLLIVGGAGFLGYYLVQGALHWNKTAAQGSADPRHRLRQLHPRRAELALGAHRRPQPDAREARHHAPAAGRHAGLPVRHPRRLDRLADLLPQVPDRDDGRQHQRPAHAARLRAAPARQAGKAVRGLPLLLQQRDLRRPDAGRTSRPRRPTAATCPARARAPATTSRSATARRCA